MSIKLTPILFVFTIGISCNSQTIKKQCASYSLFSEGLALSFETPKEEAKESITSFFLALDKSEYQQAYNILGGSISLYKDSLNRYIFLKPLPGTTNKETYYLVYRLQQYLGNISEVMLNNEVTKSYSSEQKLAESTS